MWFQRNNLETIQKKKNPFIRILKLIIFVWFIFILIKYIGYSNFISYPLIKDKQEIIVEKWDNFKIISDKLGINSDYLKLYLKLNNPEYSLKIGKFEIPENSTLTKVLESLEKPIFNTQNITILEWRNIFDIDEYLSQKSLINKWEYISYTENYEKITALTQFFPFLKWVSTLEWYLYPDTYTIDNTKFALNKFVIFQLETFEEKVYNKLFQDTNITTINFQSVINLSSIVEKEEKIKENKKTVAGILKKRLKEYWFIGADITVCYPYRLTGDECRLVISKYIRDKNEYNTRTKLGLPKTPIWNPSYETIEATLNHKDTPYYYYLHNSKGEIFYAITNAEHENNKYYYMK